MTGKLIALNLALIALLSAVGYRFQQVKAAAREREAREIGVRIVPRKYPPLAKAQPVEPLVAAAYIDIAQRILLSKDRNSEVIIDPEPVKVKPLMPPLPTVQGLMTLGEPGIIMTEKSGGQQRTYHSGDKVGPFTLVAFDSDKVLLDWNGEKVERKLDDLMERTLPPAAGVLGSPAVGAAPPVPVQAEPRGPGGELGGGYRACMPNDSTPAGTVRDGLRKFEISTPFGKSCRWEPVR